MNQEIFNILPQVGFIEALKSSVKNLFNSKGRIRRSEYWWYVLSVVILQIVLTTIFSIFYGSMSVGEIIKNGMLPFLAVLFILLVLPMALLISAQIRRMHDIGKSASLPYFSMTCNILASLCFCFHEFKNMGYIKEHQIPSENNLFTCSLILMSVFTLVQLFVLCFSLKDSQKSDNQYGKSPKYISKYTSVH